MKRYIISVKLEGDRKNYYYAKVGNSVGITRDPFMTEMFSTLSGAKSVMNMLDINHPVMFRSKAEYSIKTVTLNIK